MWRSVAVVALGGAAFAYVSACARVCSLETEQNQLARRVEQRQAENGDLSLRVGRLYESEEMRRLLVRQGFGAAAGVDEVVLVTPADDEPETAPQVAVTPTPTRRWLRLASSRVGNALADVVGTPAEASPIDPEQP